MLSEQNVLNIQKNIDAVICCNEQPPNFRIKRIYTLILEAIIYGKDHIWFTIGIKDTFKDVVINSLKPLAEQGFKVGVLDYSIGSPKEQDFIYVLVAWGNSKNIY